MSAIPTLGRIGGPRAMAHQPALDPTDNDDCLCGAIDCPTCGPQWEAPALLALAMTAQRTIRDLEHAVAHLLVLETRGERLDFVRSLAARGVMNLPAGVTAQPAKEYAPGLNQLHPNADDLIDAAFEAALLADPMNGEHGLGALHGNIQGAALGMRGGRTAHEMVVHAALSFLGRTDNIGQPL